TTQSSLVSIQLPPWNLCPAVLDRNRPFMVPRRRIGQGSTGGSSPSAYAPTTSNLARPTPRLREQVIGTVPGVPRTSKRRPPVVNIANSSPVSAVNAPQGREV